MKTVEEPLFKSYVFARVNEEEQIKIRMTAGVMNFVYWQGKPAVIPAREIETIRKFLNEYENVIAEPLQSEKGWQGNHQTGIIHGPRSQSVESGRQPG